MEEDSKTGTKPDANYERIPIPRWKPTMRGWPMGWDGMGWDEMIPRWWQLKDFVYFHPENWGKVSILTNIFQMG